MEGTLVAQDLFDEEPTLVFDDDVIDSILVDRDSRPVAGLPADFDIQPVLDEILNSLSGGSAARARQRTSADFCPRQHDRCAE